MVTGDLKEQKFSGSECLPCKDLITNSILITTWHVPKMTLSALPSVFSAVTSNFWPHYSQICVNTTKCVTPVSTTTRKCNTWQRHMWTFQGPLKSDATRMCMSTTTKEPKWGNKHLSIWELLLPGSTTTKCASTTARRRCNTSKCTSTTAWGKERTIREEKKDKKVRREKRIKQKNIVLKKYAKSGPVRWR